MSDLSTPLAPARYRPVTFGVTRVSLRDGAPGVRYLQADLPLGAFARRVTDYLVHWAETTPDHSFLARREQLPTAARRVIGIMPELCAGAGPARAASRKALIDRGLNARAPRGHPVRERPWSMRTDRAGLHLLAGVPFVPRVARRIRHREPGLRTSCATSSRRSRQVWCLPPMPRAMGRRSQAAVGSRHVEVVLTAGQRSTVARPAPSPILAATPPPLRRGGRAPCRPLAPTLS